MEKIRYHEMLPHEIMTRRKQCPIAFVATATLEWHGEHMCVGNDGVKAEKLCEMAAEKAGGFAFPTLWYGEARGCALAETNFDPDGSLKRRMGYKKKKFTHEYFGRADEQAEVEFYQSLVRHLLIQMNQLEMKAIILLTGHGPLHHWAQEPTRQFNKEFRDSIAFASLENVFVGDKTLKTVDHAAYRETSYLMYLRPDCVDMSVFLGSDLKEPLMGVRGPEPRGSSNVELGRKICNGMVDGMVKKGEQLLKRLRARK